MTRLGAEAASVQYPLITYASEIGWQPLDREEAARLRGGETGLILKEIFLDKVQKLNSEFLTRELAEE